MFHGWFNSYMGAWMWFDWLIWIILIVGVTWIIISVISRRRNVETKETAMEILKRRYANGEISREEFREMKDELKS